MEKGKYGFVVRGQPPSQKGDNGLSVAVDFVFSKVHPLIDESRFLDVAS
jgi:hypothetical protein